jgi:alpha-L-fucosidase
LGFYYSHYQDWDHPGGGAARISYAEKSQRPFRKYLDKKALPQVEELLTKYGDIAIIWFDTPMHLSESEANEFRNLVREISPGTLIGGRLDDASGDFWSMPDGRIPPNPFGEPWETCMTSNYSWGWRDPNKETRPAKEMIQHLCTIVSKGGNFLLNTGPSPTGELNQNDLAEFKKVGEWLKINGESIYGTEMNPYFESPYLCTRKENKIYFHLFEWPGSTLDIQRLKNNVKRVYLLSDQNHNSLTYNRNNGVLRVQLPASAPDSINSVLVIETEGKPIVQNSYPAEDEDGIITIPADKINLVDRRFSSRQMEGKLVRLLSTRRAWLNGWFEVKTPGKYQIVITQSGTDTVNNSYWIRINNKKYTVPVEAQNDSGFSDRSAGLIEFAKAGVYNFTIRPTDWYLRTEKVLVDIKKIQFIPI